MSDKSLAYIQPKFKDCQYDSDKSPGTLRQWIGLIGNLVRNIKNGTPIENFLDHYLGRDPCAPAVQPGFLEDSALSLAIMGEPEPSTIGTAPKIVPGIPVDDGLPEDEAKSPESFGNKTTVPPPGKGQEQPFQDIGEGDEGVTKFEKQMYPKVYAELSQQSRDLDMLLYNTISTIVTGNMLKVISDLRGDNARYTFAIIAMWKHANLAAANRRLMAMNTMSSLQFHGDAGKWKIEFNDRVREVYESGATLEHFIMQCAFKSFEGRHREAQAMIVEDINSDAIKPGMNLDRLAGKYASFIATMNAGKTTGKINYTGITCHNCGQTGHVKARCPQLNDKKNKEKDKIDKKNKEKAEAKKKAQTPCRFHAKGTCRKGASCPYSHDQKNVNQEPSGSSGSEQNSKSAYSAQFIKELIGHLSSKTDGKGSDCNAVFAATDSNRETQPKQKVKNKTDTKENGSKPSASDAHNKRAIALSLCDGMGCFGITLELEGKFESMGITEYIGVEKSKEARRVATAANRPHDAHPGVTHGFNGKNDIFDITEEDIAKLPKNALKIINATAECNDFSKLRLLPDRDDYRGPRRKVGEDPRPGLDGKYGRTFRKCIQIIGWAQKHHPLVKYFVENVDFSDMKEDWSEVCGALGKPLVITASDYSTTKRRRAYWTNIEIPETFADGIPPLDPDDYMNPGRRVERYWAQGKLCTRPLGASWKGDDMYPEAASNRKLMVVDAEFDELQEIMPEEAERLHGIPEGRTAGMGITPKMRLRCIGGGWDLNITRMLLTQWQQPSLEAMVTEKVSELESGDTTEWQEAAEALYKLDKTCPDSFRETVAAVMASLGTEAVVTTLAYRQAMQNMISAELGSVIDSGAGRHVSDLTVIENENDRKKLHSFTGQESWTNGNGHIPLSVYDDMSGQQVEIDIDDADHFESAASLLSMCKLIKTGWNFELNNENQYAYTPTGQRITLTMENDVIRMPHEIRQGEEAKRLPAPAEINNVTNNGDLDTASFFHRLFNHASSEKVHETLRVTKGFKQPTKHMPSCHCEACAQGNARRHKGHLRHPKKPARSESQQAFSVFMAGIPEGDNAEDCSPQERMTESSSESGDSTQEFDTEDDWEDYQANTSDGSEDSDIVQIFKTGDAEDSDSSDYESEAEEQNEIYEEPIEDDEGLMNEGIQDWEFTAPVAGRQIVAKPLRFENITKIRPWEYMFVDEKEYDIPQRGGWTTSLILLELRGDAWFKVDETRKTQHGRSFRKLMIQNGVHLLDYPRHVYHDGCGSMKHVRDEALKLGINAIQIPPYCQSLNEAERVADRAWAAGRTLLADSRAPLHLMALAVDFACYMKLRMATTATRDWLTPYEILRGDTPNISHCMPFYTKTFVTVPKEKRAKLKKKGLGHLRSEEGRLVGYLSMWDNTPKVLLTGNRVVHSRHVEYSLVRDVKQEQARVTPKQIEEKKLDALKQAQLLEAIDENMENEDEQAASPIEEGDLNDGTLSNETSAPGGEFMDQSEQLLDEFTRPEEGWLETSRANRKTAGRKKEPADRKPAEGSRKNQKPSKLKQPRQYKPKKNWDEHNNRNTDLFEDVESWIDMGQPIDDQTASEAYQSRAWRSRLRRPAKHHNATTFNVMQVDDNPRDVFHVQMDKIFRLEHDLDIFTVKLDEARAKLNNQSKSGDVEAHLEVAIQLALEAQKDMKWDTVLNSEHREKAIEAKNKEFASLCKTILTKLSPLDKDWEVAIKQATPGRVLLDIKRSGQWKARAVKQGFRENKELTDGADFNYYSSVVKMYAVRMALFRRRRLPTRVVWVKDISTAFLQSDKYGDGIYKYVSFKDPVTKKIEYYRQSGPIYGEASAPVRWESTIAPWLEEQGFVRGANERSVFYNEERDLLLLLYVDDVLADGAKKDVEWIFDLLEERFECKDAEKLTKDTPLDYLGIDIHTNGDRVYMSMAKYIENSCKILGIEKGGREVSTPLSQPIDTEDEKLNPAGVKEFLTATGMLGWLAQTVRCDVAYAYSRIAQHSAHPTQSAMDAVRRTFKYLQSTKDLTLSAEWNTGDLDIAEAFNRLTLENNEWSFYTDSDHAGNAEPQNKRRSQNGMMALLNGAPVSWASKATSVTFATDKIGEAHADMSSGAAEVYAAGNATLDIMALSYVVEEMGMNFPMPFKLEMDNEAARIFAANSAQRTKLKHIDCRQHWVRMLRDKDICNPVHVDTKKNLADIFTKILPAGDFERLRDSCMVKLQFDEELDEK